MSAHPELNFIAKLLETGEMQKAVDAGITEQHFTGESQQAFRFIRQYWGRRKHGGSIPTREMVEARVQDLDLPTPDYLSFDSALHDLQDCMVRREIQDVCNAAINEVQTRSAPTVLTMLRSRVDGLMMRSHKSKDLKLDSSAFSALERYEENRYRVGYSGIPYPWETLNEETGGMQNGEFIVFYARPKCVVAGQRVLDSSGRLEPIEATHPVIAGLNDQQVRWANCSKFKAGRKQALRITTRSGHTVAVGKDHPFIRPDLEFTPGRDLKVGDYVGVARKLPEPEHPINLSQEQARMLGYLIGDGNYTRSEIQFTKGDKDVLNEVARLSDELGVVLHRAPSQTQIERRIVAKKGQPNYVLKWLRDLGCHGEKSKVKRVPKEIFQCSNQIVAEFLSGYTDTDGHVSARTIVWSTASYGLAQDIKHLLLRFGVTAHLATVTTNFNTTAYTLQVMSQEQHKILFDVLRLVSKKKAKGLRDLATRRIRQKRHNDGIPYSDRLYDLILDAKGSRDWHRMWRGFSRGKLFRRTGKISRHLLRTLAQHLDAPQLLNWADSDIRWEPIVGIEPLGLQECWDVSMQEGDPAYIVENFITHNSQKSWSLMYIATNAYVNHNKRVLVYTREMTPAQMQDRALCLMLGAPYTAFKKGRLHEYDHPEGGTLEDRFYDLVSRLESDEETVLLETGEHRQFIITSDRDDRNGGGVMGLRQKVELYKPDLICVDAIYLMRNDRGGKRSVKWDDITAITQDLKDVALDFGKPLVGTTQANRRQEETREYTMANIGFSDSFGQDCDLAIYIGLKRTKDPNRSQLAFVVTGSREMNLHGFAVNGCPASDFSQIMVPAKKMDGTADRGDDGNPLVVPLIFQCDQDVRDFFKDEIAAPVRGEDQVMKSMDDKFKKVKC